ncbi:hypothetical protein LINGRAHAP2_LOCUS36016 [Linum grandiflorum]
MLESRSSKVLEYIDIYSWGILYSNLKPPNYHTNRLIWISADRPNLIT